MKSSSGPLFGRDFLQSPQVEFASAQVRQRFYVHKLIGLRPPQRRQIGLGEKREAWFEFVFRERMQDDQVSGEILLRKSTTTSANVSNSYFRNESDGRALTKWRRNGAR